MSYGTRTLRIAIDAFVLSVAFWLAFVFRFDAAIPQAYQLIAWSTWPAMVLGEYVVMHLMGVTRFSWRYIAAREALLITAAIGVATALFVVVRVLFVNHETVAERWVVPFGVLAMNAVMAVAGAVGARTLVRVWRETEKRRSHARPKAEIRVLLVGAGEAGAMVVRELASRPDLGLVPVGFVDDNREKRGTQIHGIPVLGAVQDVIAVAREKRASRVLLTIANPPSDFVRALTMRCRDAGLEIKMIPGLYEIVGEHVNLSRIRDVSIDDLLGREAVSLDQEKIRDLISARVVMVTGAGGSIGSELCRQVCRFGPRRLLLVERFENALFEIHRELAASHPALSLVPLVADVCDPRRMETIFGEKPDVVIHAAAHKHVPMMEENPGEAVKNNIGGTRLLADLSHRADVQHFVMISTDKAVNPTSVMGATKRIAEMIVQDFATRSQTKFSNVRFGNVLGSNGSVIPIFRQQIAQGGPVTVTHPDMTRYFMTIPEAAQLVLQAGSLGRGGEVFILDMGKPVRIVDLARDLITLSGLKPGIDIEIAFSGIRPGEKLFEEIATDAENAQATLHPKIVVAAARTLETGLLEDRVSLLLRAADLADGSELRRHIHDLVTEYDPTSTRPSHSLLPSPEATS